MAGEITTLHSPIDAMYLIHKALRVKAAQVAKVADQLEIGASLQPFKLAFNSWAAVLLYHAEQEDKHLAVPLSSRGSLRYSQDGQGMESTKRALMALDDNLHRELVETIEDLMKVLNEEIGRTSLIARTKQHLFQQVLALRIAQEDHLETEEALILPLVRERMDEQQQLDIARRLLIDEEAEDPRWIIDWVARELDPGEQKLLADLEARFTAID